MNVRVLLTFSRSPGFPVNNACHACGELIVDVGYTTVHCRRPNVSRRRGTNMEPFASRSNVIKLPANLQNQTKILFILGVVSIVFQIVKVFVKCLECFGIFHFKFNVMFIFQPTETDFCCAIFSCPCFLNDDAIL